MIRTQGRITYIFKLQYLNFCTIKALLLYYTFFMTATKKVNAIQISIICSYVLYNIVHQFIKALHEDI